MKHFIPGQRTIKIYHPKLPTDLRIKLMSLGRNIYRFSDHEEYQVGRSWRALSASPPITARSVDWQNWNNKQI